MAAVFGDAGQQQMNDRRKSELPLSGGVARHPDRTCAP